MRLVPINDINSEMELARPIIHKDSVLLNKGITDLERYKNRLMQLGVNYVYVNDRYSRDIIVNEVIEEETKLKSRQIIQETLEDITFRREINTKKIMDVISLMIEDIMNFDGVMVNMVDIKTFDSYTFAHSVNVAVLSLFLGKSLNLTMDELKKLGVGALLHDIGKMLVPAAIINKPGKLTDEEFEIIQEHPFLGFDYLRDNYLISAVSRNIILNHHERLDGTGYPKGMVSDKIHDFARLVAVTDVFDALTSDRIYRKKWSIPKTVDYLMSNVSSKFDYNFVEKFTRNIAVYPNGTMVNLSSGQQAVVKEQNQGFPTRPVVRVLYDEEGLEITEHPEIDLMKKLDVVILDD